MNAPRHFMLVVMLAAIGLRSVLGAPCCAFVTQAVEAQAVEAQAVEAQAGQHDGTHADHAEHAEHAQNSGHSGHGDDPSANPCCSACGPTLPPEPAQLLARSLLVEKPAPSPIRRLATRPPFPAYEARGPPLLI